MADFVLPIRPRYGEVDRMGFVYHAHYLVYFELGRTEWMRTRGCRYADVEQAGYRLVVAQASLRCRRPAHYDQPLWLAVRVVRVGGASVCFEYALRSADGQLLADGSTRLGCVDQQARPCRLPPELLERLSAGSQTPPPPSELP